MHSVPGPSRRAEENAALQAWLHQAAAYLAGGTDALAPPPSPDLQPTYESVLASRREIHQAQRELVENLRAQSLETVGSMLAHDLHNLSLRLALLSQNLDRFYGDPEFLQSAKHILDDTVERMRGLVTSFRERRENVLIKIRVEVNDLLSALVKQMGLHDLAGIDLYEDYRADTAIWADPFFLGNAFRVLLENAVEAMPSGGGLWLRTHSAPDAGVEVEIEDSGSGMTPEFVERELFAAFRSGGNRGLGLGMYICRQIIQLHDGLIQVDSEPGRGTRFRLSFPPAPAAT